MKLRLTIAPDGRMGFFTQSGTFVEGKKAIAELLAALQADGVMLADVSEPEQHRHDGTDKVRANEDLHAH